MNRLLVLLLPLLASGCGAFRWMLGIPDENGNLPPGPPDSHGVPFYQDFHFWAWAVGIGATGYHTLIAEGIPKLPTIPFTPTHGRRRARRKQTTSTTSGLPFTKPPVPPQA